MCPLISASPCKKAVKKVKDEDTGETIELRKYHYTFSKSDVYNFAIRHPTRGGFPGFRHPDDESKVWIQMTSFEKLLPPNLSRMTNSQKQMMGCKVHLDMHAFISTMIHLRNRSLKTLGKLVDALKDSDAEDEVKKVRDKYDQMLFLPAVDGKPREQKISTIDSYLEATTCQRVGDTEFTHYKCALNHCTNCPKPPIHDSE